VFGEAASRLAGFTAAQYTGVAGGREVMHARCAQQFAGSHLCHTAEYTIANSATVPPASGAWIDFSGGVRTDAGLVQASLDLGDVTQGRYVSQLYSGNCDNWTAAIDSSTVTRGLTITPATATSDLCTAMHALACCSTPYVEKFRGFTAALTTGVHPGGRAEMHQLCGAEFAGSHMCHAAEYARAASTTSPPAGGAWLDYSGFLRSSTQATAEIASGDVGRYSGQLYSGNCDNWTAAIDSSTVTRGLTITTSGATSALCTDSHPIACCQ